jgi:hypothetical protein
MITTAIDNTSLVEQYRANRKITDAALFKMINNSFYFNMYLLTTLPMGFIAGLKVKSFDGHQCSITVPYRWLNQNPFSSTYFAVLAMAAEMSTGMLGLMATHQSKPSVSMLVTRLEAQFVKKATGLTTFTCKQGDEMVAVVEDAILTGEGKNFTAISTGLSQSGEEEARFAVQWSFKMRAKK